MTEFAGTLRDRVVIEQLADVRNASGLQETRWEPLHMCWAAVKPDGWGAESEAAALSAAARFRVTIRTGPSLEPGHRVRWRRRSLLVKQVVFDPREADRLTLRCEEMRT